MEIVIGDLLAKVPIDEEQEVPSPHSGRNLRSRSFVIRLDKTRENAPVLDTLSELKKDSVVTERTAEAGERRWKVIEHSSSSRSVNNGPFTHTHRFTVVEDETLAPDALLLQDLRLVPYRFDEKARTDGRIEIRARVKVSKEDSERLFKMMDGNPFAAVREGIQATPRQMRFGQCLWSEDGDEVKHSLLLIEPDPARPHKNFRLLEPQFWNTRVATVRSTLAIRALLRKLQEKGILSETEAEELTRYAEDDIRAAFEEFWRVDDVDDWHDGVDGDEERQGD